LDGYTVELFSAGKDIQTLAKQLSKTTGLPIRVLPHCARTEIVKMMGRARVIIGLSISDGTPNTMLEAMIMGALPIQTDAGGATGEWITDGENGLIVPPEDVDLVAAAIRRALGDDALIDRAMQLNEKLANERLDDELIRSRVIARYEMAGRQAHPDKEESC
jgi:glycosyltransferase involved in cell wall biosynthesis